MHISLFSRNSSNQEKGRSLIEVIAIIAVMAILLIAALIVFNKGFEYFKQRETAKQISLASMRYKLGHFTNSRTNTTNVTNVNLKDIIPEGNCSESALACKTPDNGTLELKSYDATASTFVVVARDIKRISCEEAIVQGAFDSVTKGDFLSNNEDDIKKRGEVYSAEQIRNNPRLIQKICEEVGTYSFITSSECKGENCADSRDCPMGWSKIAESKRGQGTIPEDYNGCCKNENIHNGYCGRNGETCGPSAQCNPESNAADGKNASCPAARPYCSDDCHCGACIPVPGNCLDASGTPVQGTYCEPTTLSCKCDDPCQKINYLDAGATFECIPDPTKEGMQIDDICHVCRSGHKELADSAKTLVCANACCAAGSTCTADGWCSSGGGKCTDTLTCTEDQICCNSACYDDKSYHCCKKPDGSEVSTESKKECCNTAEGFCPLTQECCGDHCCPADQVCCKAGCCKPDPTDCGGTKCPTGQVCCIGAHGQKKCLPDPKCGDCQMCTYGFEDATKCVVNPEKIGDYNPENACQICKVDGKYGWEDPQKKQICGDNCCEESVKCALNGGEGTCCKYGEIVVERFGKKVCECPPPKSLKKGDPCSEIPGHCDDSCGYDTDGALMICKDGICQNPNTEKQCKDNGYGEAPRYKDDKCLEEDCPCANPLSKNFLICLEKKCQCSSLPVNKDDACWGECGCGNSKFLQCSESTTKEGVCECKTPLPVGKGKECLQSCDCGPAFRCDTTNRCVCEPPAGSHKLPKGEICAHDDCPGQCVLGTNCRKDTNDGEERCCPAPSATEFHCVANQYDKNHCLVKRQHDCPHPGDPSKRTVCNPDDGKCVECLTYHNCPPNYYCEAHMCKVCPTPTDSCVATSDIYYPAGHKYEGCIQIKATTCPTNTWCSCNASHSCQNPVCQPCPTPAHSCSAAQEYYGSDVGTQYRGCLKVGHFNCPPAGEPRKTICDAYPPANGSVCVECLTSPDCVAKYGDNHYCENKQCKSCPVESCGAMACCALDGALNKCKKATPLSHMTTVTYNKWVDNVCKTVTEDFCPLNGAVPPGNECTPCTPCQQWNAKQSKCVTKTGYSGATVCGTSCCKRGCNAAGTGCCYDENGSGIPYGSKTAFSDHWVWSANTEFTADSQTPRMTFSIYSILSITELSLKDVTTGASLLYCNSMSSCASSGSYDHTFNLTAGHRYKVVANLTNKCDSCNIRYYCK